MFVYAIIYKCLCMLSYTIVFVYAIIYNSNCVTVSPIYFCGDMLCRMHTLLAVSYSFMRIYSEESFLSVHDFIKLYCKKICLRIRH